MRAMLFCITIAFVVVWAYLCLHYGKEVGKSLKKFFSKIF